MVAPDYRNNKASICILEKFSFVKKGYTVKYDRFPRNIYYILEIGI